MKFSSSNISVQRCLYLLKINAPTPIFCCSIFFEQCLNPQVRINKMVNKHTVDYHPSLSELTSSIHPLIFLWTSKGFFFPEYFLKLFSNLYIPPWLRKNFKFMVVRLLENTFLSQKTESVHFHSCPQVKLLPGCYHHHSKQKEFTHFPRERREDYGAEKMTKIKLARVLVTSFDEFHHFCNLYIFGFRFAVP